MRPLETKEIPNSNYFKSFVSTNFTTRALMDFMSIYAIVYNVIIKKKL